MNRSYWPWLIHPQIPCRPSVEALWARSHGRRRAWPGVFVAATVVAEVNKNGGFMVIELDFGGFIVFYSVIPSGYLLHSYGKWFI